MQSDHGAFHAAGIPFVYFGVEDHPDYHKPTDTFDKIDRRVLLPGRRDDRRRGRTRSIGRCRRRAPVSRRRRAPASDLTERLDRLYDEFNELHSVSDPIWIVRRYERADDREVVGFCAAALAFGRVQSVLNSIEGLLKVMGPSPAALRARVRSRARSARARSSGPSLDARHRSRGAGLDPAADDRVARFDRAVLRRWPGARRRPRSSGRSTASHAAPAGSTRRRSTGA